MALWARHVRVLRDERNLTGRAGYVRVTRGARLDCARALNSIEGPPALFVEILRFPGPVLTLGAL
jgi:hypothetical protein